MQLPAGLEHLAQDRAIALEHFGIISVSGEQRDEFLHGQLTVNVKNLTSNQARRTAHCDFKGKTWSISLIARYQDSLLLSLNQDALTHSLAQFKKYAVFSKVSIEDASAHWHQYVVSGPRTADFIHQHFGAVPDSNLSAQSGETGLAIGLDQPSGHTLLLLTDTGRQSFQAYCSEQDVTLYPGEVFEALAAQAGVPDVCSVNINELVPQMMNLQALGGIDFNKGCYMGQEVVARTRYLGKNKRQAQVFRLPQATNVLPGDMVEMQLGENWRRAGTVIRRGVLGQETWIMAVLPKDTDEGSTFRLAQYPDVPLNLMSLPYAVDDTESARIAGS